MILSINSRRLNIRQGACRMKVAIPRLTPSPVPPTPTGNGSIGTPPPPTPVYSTALPAGDAIYVTVQGDWWDLIALKVYGMQRGNEHLMYRLLEENYRIAHIV